MSAIRRGAWGRAAQGVDVTREDMLKSRIRYRAEVTGETHAQARTRLAHYPPPRRRHLDAADALPYDPVVHQLSVDARLPAATDRIMGRLRGNGPDCHELEVPDHFGPAERRSAPGRLAMIARAESYDGLPALAVECVDVVQGHGKPPVAWLTSMDIELHEHGFEYDAHGAPLRDWRVELTPNPDTPSAPVAITVRSDSFVLFDGFALLSPSWLVRTPLDPTGLLVVVGPVSGSLFPQPFDDDRVDTMLGTGDLAAARIMVAPTLPYQD